MCNFEAFSKYVFNNAIIKHLNFVLSVLWYIIMLFEFYTLNMHIILYNKYICKQESKSGLLQLHSISTESVFHSNVFIKILYYNFILSVIKV